MSQCVYLAIGDQVHGPYTQSDLARMEKSGELRKFHFVWNYENKDWVSLHKPPAPIKSATKSAGKFDCIVFEREHVAYAKLDELESGGCRVQSDSLLAERAPVTINISNTRSGRSVSLAGTVTRSMRTLNGWIYHVRWNNQTEAFVNLD